MTVVVKPAQKDAFDAEALRLLVREKYREVATNPHGEFHFHTGRQLARQLGYPERLINRVPDEAVEAFAGVANPVMAGPIAAGTKVVDVGSGGGFDSLVMSRLVGKAGHVIGVDMTPEMLEQTRASAEALQLGQVELRQGDAEALPVDDASVDVVISNGVLNLTTDKNTAFSEIMRVLKPGGRLLLGDIVVAEELSEGVRNDIDLWTA